MDDAYLGGERVGGKRGRGSKNKSPFVAAVELHDGHRSRVRFDWVANSSFKALLDWHEVALMSDRNVTSDGLIDFNVPNRNGMDHQVVYPSHGKVSTKIAPHCWLRGFRLIRVRPTPCVRWLRNGHD